MSVSIFYEARRSMPLSASEEAEAHLIVENYSVDTDIKQYIATGKGLNWESFDLILNPRPGVIMAGSTKLPDITDEAAFRGVEHWGACLAELRKTIKGVDWTVTVEDAPLHWDEKRQFYDLTK